MKKSLLFCIVLLLVPCLGAHAQQYSVSGRLADSSGPVLMAEVRLLQGDSLRYKITTDNGRFMIKPVRAGFYYVRISAPGYEDPKDSVRVSADVDMGTIRLLPAAYMLDEVSVVDRVLAMVQKDDTLEYNSGAYKVHPDADAADLVKKMPGIEINNKQVTAQGENVIKVLLDGKPFFGEDPYAALKNMPADMIQKVQVYNEKGEQEKFTGFSEGGTSKTVNIITKPNRKNGFFGSLYGGGGGDNNSNDIRYGAGAALNKFGGSQRVTLTAQTNNVNAQNFSTEQSGVSRGSSGLTRTNSAEMNYTDEWGKKLEISGSYFINNVRNEAVRDMRKTYVLSTDSGQVYTERNPNESDNTSHRASMRVTFTADSMNSLLWTPQMSYTDNRTTTIRDGSTMALQQPVNTIADANTTSGRSYTIGNNLLYRHRFHKRGRTFSLSANGSNSNSEGHTMHRAQSMYYASPALNNTLDQQAIQNQNNWNLAGNATYTEPLHKNGLLKTEYSIGYVPAHSGRSTYNYSYIDNAYSLPDSQYSNTFYSNNLTHKAGMSYQFSNKALEVSVGLNYQLTQLNNDQRLPISYQLHQDFNNLLPVASLRYKISKTKHLSVNYNPNTQVPGVSQNLQNL